MPSAASAQDYDIDCKLILCLPGGFPSGCGDAYRHLADRLRDGKPPIDFCTQSDGTEYDAFDIDIDDAILPAQSTDAWDCPVSKTLYHHGCIGGEDPCYRVNTFCDDRAHAFGAETRARYTGRTPPEGVDFRTKLTLEPGTPATFTQGWQQFYASMGRDWSTEISFSE